MCVCVRSIPIMLIVIVLRLAGRSDTKERTHRTNSAVMCLVIIVSCSPILHICLFRLITCNNFKATRFITDRTNSAAQVLQYPAEARGVASRKQREERTAYACVHAGHECTCCTCALHACVPRAKANAWVSRAQPRVLGSNTLRALAFRRFVLFWW